MADIVVVNNLGDKVTYYGIKSVSFETAEYGVIAVYSELELATLERAGIVKPDGKTIIIDESGTISTVSESYSKDEVDTMMQELSDMLLTNSDLEMVYAATNDLMGDNTEFTGLGASLLRINALADALLA